jgi:hypothetical protein
MSDDTSPSPSLSPPAEDAGKNRRDGVDVNLFTSPKRESGPSSKSGPAPGGKKKPGRGRPPKNVAGFPKEEIDEVVDDPEIEAARQEFEAILVGLLVSTTDNIADSRFELLKTEYPEAVAKGLADKARLTEKEREYFGAVAIRIWRKYLGDKYLFSDEGVAAMYALNYLIRNWEPMSQSKKIEAKINGNKKPGSDQQSGLQSQARPNSRSESNGKIDAGIEVDRNASRNLGPHL